MAVSHSRSQVIDFCEFLNVDDHVIIYKYPTLEHDIAGFMKPFSVLVSNNAEVCPYSG